jgi:two-component system response regulator NreC
MAALAGENRIAVVLADDHAVMRSGLRALLDAEADLEVKAEAGDILTTFREVRVQRPSVLVLDLNMPGGSSIEAIPRLKLLSPRTSVVVLTMEEDALSLRDALLAGASGYVLKHAAAAELVRAIRTAAAGAIPG